MLPGDSGAHGLAAHGKSVDAYLRCLHEQGIDAGVQVVRLIVSGLFDQAALTDPEGDLIASGNWRRLTAAIRR